MISEQASDVQDAFSHVAPTCEESLDAALIVLHLWDVPYGSAFCGLLRNRAKLFL